jgi:hypothetical protein
MARYPFGRHSETLIFILTTFLGALFYICLLTLQIRTEYPFLIEGENFGLTKGFFQVLPDGSADDDDNVR